MQWRNNTQRYGALSIALHWGMLLLLAAVYGCMELKGVFPRGSDAREAMKTWHFMLGLSVLALVLLRLALFLSSPVPRIVPEPPRLQTRIATLMKIALYAFMLLTPLAGWLVLSAKGSVIPFFGLQLPALMAENADAADWIKEIHETVATAGYFLIATHALAALYHHYLVRDNTLQRILPQR